MKWGKTQQPRRWTETHWAWWPVTLDNGQTIWLESYKADYYTFFSTLPPATWVTSCSRRYQ